MHSVSEPVVDILLRKSVSYPVWLIPGVITCVVGRREDTTLKSIQQAADDENWATVSKLLNHAEATLIQQINADEPGSLSVNEIESVGELWYANRAVITGLLQLRRESAICTDFLVYAGGILDVGKFNFHYMTKSEIHDMMCILLVNPPAENSLEHIIEKSLANQLGDELTFRSSPLNLTVAAAKEVGKFVTSYVAGKAVDEVVRAERDAARRREKLQHQVDAQARENQQRRMREARNEYRNASAVPPASISRLFSRKDLNQAQLADQLLESRLELIREMFSELEERREAE